MLNYSDTRKKNFKESFVKVSSSNLKKTVGEASTNFSTSEKSDVISELVHRIGDKFSIKSKDRDIQECFPTSIVNITPNPVDLTNLRESFLLKSQNSQILTSLDIDQKNKIADKKFNSSENESICSGNGITLNKIVDNCTECFSKKNTYDFSNNIKSSKDFVNKLSKSLNISKNNIKFSTLDMNKNNFIPIKTSINAKKNSKRRRKISVSTNILPNKDSEEKTKSTNSKQDYEKKIIVDFLDQNVPTIPPNFKIEIVTSDKYMFFRCVAKKLFDDQNSYLSILTKSIAYIRKNKTLFMQHIINITEYLKRISANEFDDFIYISSAMSYRFNLYFYISSISKFQKIYINEKFDRKIYILKDGENFELLINNRNSEIEDKDTIDIKYKINLPCKKNKNEARFSDLKIYSPLKLNKETAEKISEPLNSLESIDKNTSYDISRRNRHKKYDKYNINVNNVPFLSDNEKSKTLVKTIKVNVSQVHESIKTNDIKSITIKENKPRILKWEDVKSLENTLPPNSSINKITENSNLKEINEKNRTGEEEKSAENKNLTIEEVCVENNPKVSEKIVNAFSPKQTYFYSNYSSYFPFHNRSYSEKNYIQNNCDDYMYESMSCGFYYPEFIFYDQFNNYNYYMNPYYMNFSPYCGTGYDYLNNQYTNKHRN